MRLKEIKNAKDLESVLEDAGESLVVIDFFAKWCGPCQRLTPQIKELASENENIVFCKVDIEKTEDLSREYKVASLPTILFIKNGKQVAKVVGANVDAIKENIKKYE